MHQFNLRAIYSVSESRNPGMYGLTTAETYLKWLKREIYDNCRSSSDHKFDKKNLMKGDCFDHRTGDK